MAAACRCVSNSALEMASSSDEPEASAYANHIRAFLDGLFRHLCSGGEQAGLLQQPWVMASVVRLIGNYSLWFGATGGEDVPLTGALQVLLKALPVAEVSQCHESCVYAC